MKVRPILMSAPMIQALIAGKKTQTRRIMQKQPYECMFNPPHFSDMEPGDLFICPDMLPTSNERGRVIVECIKPWHFHDMGQRAFAARHSPYGVQGDLLWVRENIWMPRNLTERALRDGADTWPDCIYMADNEDERDWVKENNWKSVPSIHMPKWLSRFTLEITEVRIEQLQSITEEDARAEGIEVTEYYREEHPPSICYSVLMDKINGKGTWKSNPWVWVVTFKVRFENILKHLVPNSGKQHDLIDSMMLTFAGKKVRSHG